MVRIATAAFALAASLIGITANAQQLMLLDFWSPHCGPCMQMKPIVHSYEQVGYPIRAVDTTRDGQLSQQYGVSQIPCFVMLVNGKETERQVGAIGSDGLKQMFERAKDEVRRQNGVRSQSPDQIPTVQVLAGEERAARRSACARKRANHK
jgi:thioredoxin-like negative regulator of GroEL